jgi:hypothetical protein
MSAFPGGSFVEHSIAAYGLPENVQGARCVNQSGYFQNGGVGPTLTPWNEKRTMFFICSYPGRQAC